jgi:hypothetical protein
MLLPKLKNNTWTTLAIESVLIVLSVVVGFIVTEWRQAQENEEMAASARESVLTEIRQNRELVQDARAYHVALRDTLASLQDPSPETVGKIVTSGVDGTRGGFVSPAEVVATAWKTAQTTGAIRHMDFSASRTLARAYEKQDLYREHTTWFGQSIMTRILQGGTVDVLENPQRLDPILSQFIAQEKQLLDTYDRVLRDMEKANE